MPKFILYRLFIFWFLSFIISCKGKETIQESAITEAMTPVTVATVSKELMEDYVELNATSAFLQKWYVKANITVYLGNKSACSGMNFINAGKF